MRSGNMLSGYNLFLTTENGINSLFGTFIIQRNHAQMKPKIPWKVYLRFGRLKWKVPPLLEWSELTISAFLLMQPDYQWQLSEIVHIGLMYVCFNMSRHVGNVLYICLAYVRYRIGITLYFKYYFYLY